MKKTIAFAIIMGLLLIGCGDPKVSKSSQKHGSSKNVRPMKNGKLHGVVKKYNNKGVLTHEASYVEGKKEGLTIDYYSDGRTFMEIPYVNDKRHGMVKKYWHDTESIRALEPYVNGKEHGVSKTFTEDGKPRLLYHSRDGVLHGPYTYWGMNGGGAETRNYINGTYEGGRALTHSERHRLSREMDTTAKSNKSSSSNIVQLQCGGTSHVPTPTTMAMAKGEGSGVAAVYISKHGKLNQREALNYCTTQINMIKTPCGDARAYVSACVSQFVK